MKFFILSPKLLEGFHFDHIFQIARKAPPVAFNLPGEGMHVLVFENTSHTELPNLTVVATSSVH